ncbi:TRAUB-domain-containing protein [Coniophora puteana RWD-64-598 SS2]|uniref:Protein BFR2 n=1 Tax=Coniophora puteana (strain RWD-64-598) TaxID=741705 RepID=A0A5M3MJK7_CONPW|nr:TRAUB-domain-containing protein [Coniophora puteana RWD-64-598 SS2]EIW79177.1 TRAUB-domain-containing protein [Coniophora puteana RWD-64-598 SS2]
MQRLSLSEQIAQLEEAAPVDFDPEDVQAAGADPDEELASGDPSAAREHYLDVGPSALRKAQDSIADPKYGGRKASRKELSSNDDDLDRNTVGSSDDDKSGLSDDHPEEEEGQSSQDLDSEAETPQRSQLRASLTIGNVRVATSEDLSANLHKTREDDRKKGRAVSRQIALWDTLLDSRIRLQKSVHAGNRLPALSQYSAVSEVQASLNKMLVEALQVSEEIMELQEELLSSNESIQAPPRKKLKTDGPREGDVTQQLRDASNSASALENVYHPFFIQTLNKWSSKIQAVAPSVLLPSNRNAFNRNSHQLKSASQLIDETLSDHSKVLARTQVYRGKGSRIDHDVEDGQEDAEIFDDTDFYHQLLRDVIDSRGNGSGGNNDWMAIQKQKKAKKKVDTKASKGRKLRYEVQEKVQNFMVPIPLQGSWHEEQIDELFASVLGKGFEDAMPPDEPQEDPELLMQADIAIQDGFRVFG